MLTGDKVETATCIAMSAGFKSRHQQLYYMKELTSLKQCESSLQKFALAAEKNILMIDGQTLDVFLSNKIMEERFF
jgi:phospholipid-translocating ATPase